VAAALDHRTPRLQILRMVCSHDPYFPRSGMKVPPVSVSMGTFFAREIAAVHQAPCLDTFHFCAMDGCATWRKWGGPDEVVCVMPPLEHAPWAWNSEY
jgi:hypothetical protein